MPSAPGFGMPGAPDLGSVILTKVEVFILDAYVLKSNLSMLRLVMTPDPCEISGSTTNFRITRDFGEGEPFRITPNCVHGATVQVSDCEACDNGRVLLSKPPAERLLYGGEVQQAIKWLMKNLNELCVPATVLIDEGETRNLQWYIDNPPPPEPVVQDWYYYTPNPSAEDPDDRSSMPATPKPEPAVADTRMMTLAVSYMQAYNSLYPGPLDETSETSDAGTSEPPPSTEASPPAPRGTPGPESSGPQRQATPRPQGQDRPAFWDPVRDFDAEGVLGPDGAKFLGRRNLP